MLTSTKPGAYPGCSGTRKLSDNLNDLKAQIAANTKGANLVQSLIAECGIRTVSCVDHSFDLRLTLI